MKYLLIDYGPDLQRCQLQVAIVKHVTSSGFGFEKKNKLALFPVRAVLKNIRAK